VCVGGGGGGGDELIKHLNSKKTSSGNEVAEFIIHIKCVSDKIGELMFCSLAAVGQGCKYVPIYKDITHTCTINCTSTVTIYLHNR